MKRNNFWRWALVILVTAWSISSFYPPASENLIESFQARATARDASFTNIVAAARTLEKDRPTRNFANLLDSSGTNDLTKYFPTIKVTGEKNPNRAILNRLQRDGAGKIKLGLDLQGGTSFLVGVDTSRVTADGTNTTVSVTVEQKAAVLEQAIEVLRKRVDKFGVAEPILQPSGDNRILIQLPGLSEADIESAKQGIQKAAYLEFRLVHPESQQLIAQGLGAPGYEKLALTQRSQNGRPGSYLFPGQETG